VQSVVVSLTVVAALLIGCGAAETTSGAGGHNGDKPDAGASGGAAPYDGPPIPWAFAPFPRVIAPKDNPTTDAKVALGNLLFYDPILASDSLVACATCHSEDWGMGDGLPLSVGVDGVGPVGPSRVGPNVTTRNALTLWNAAFRDELFWDGRAPSLELQALQPMKHPNEMNQPADEAIKRIASVSDYRKLFNRAFPGDDEAITVDHVTGVLAAFERTIVSDNSPYDQYVGGDVGAIAANEKRGMKLFAESHCASCHAPPLFESMRYEKRFASDDPGRFAVTGNAKDRGAFRVPTLRNLRDTTPYFHDGSVADLEQAVRDELDREVAKKHAKPLSDGEFQDLVSFLYSSLEDVSRNPSRPHAVPSGLPVPIDGDQIQR
jgi:cytochrome c peroxidase